MKYFAILSLLLICGNAWAQVTGEIKDVKIDDARGSIIVETQYKINSQVVDVDGTVCVEKDGKYYNGTKECIGRSRYTEESGKDNAEIIAKAKEDVALHAENLVKRIVANATYIQTKSLETQKALTEPIKDAIKDDLVGHKVTKTESITTYKGKDIKVTYDSKNTISDTAITP